MNPKLSDYFAQKRLEEKQARDALLISQGLYEKVYAPNDEWSEEYPENEYDQERQTIRYFKKVAIEVTDEEYEQIKKYAVKPPIFLPKPNVIAKILLGVGICVYGLGFIGGMQLQSAAEELLSLAIIVWAIAAVGGTILLGLSEIVKLLQNIRDKN